MKRNDKSTDFRLAIDPITMAARLKRLPYLLAFFAPGFAFAGPTGGDVVGGIATISTPDASHTVIDQSSQNAIVNWQQFNVGSNEYVIFNQPNASASILNRIIGGNASEILGNITANGRVFLINPQGIIFGQGATIDVGGLVASTLNIKNEDFMAGRYVLAGDSTAGIVNHGTIKAKEKGFVVLAGDYVHNKGVIEATAGTVVLASGSRMTLDMDGSGLVNYAVSEAALSEHAGVENSGSLIADGGRVVMTARVAGELSRSVVNNQGLVRAQAIVQKGGEIYLTGNNGSVSNSGTLDASGTNGQNGGSVHIHANGNVRHAGTINVRGKNGGTSRLIAELTLTTELGSVVDGRADDSSTGSGGFVELSGHQSFVLAGETKLGKGGTLLLDPTEIIITGGSGNGTPPSGVVYETDIENALFQGTNYYLVASNNIRAQGNFTDYGIDALARAGSTTPIGGLLLGIGSGPYGPSGSSGFSGFTRQAPNGSASPAGSINLSGITINNNSTSANLSLSSDGAIAIYGGTTLGDVVLGKVVGKQIDIAAFGNITADSVFLSKNASPGSINLSSSNGRVVILSAAASTDSQKPQTNEEAQKASASDRFFREPNKPEPTRPHRPSPDDGNNRPIARDETKPAPEKSRPDDASDNRKPRDEKEEKEKKEENKRERADAKDPDALNNSKEIIRVKDSKPLDTGKSCA